MKIAFTSAVFRVSRVAAATLALCAAVSLLCACSSKKAPEPPRAKADLLLDIYTSIAKDDHKGAFNKILRLKEIDKNSVFLTELEVIERNNMYLVEARRLLDSGDIAAATELLDGALKRHGKLEDLEEARENIATLSEISALIDRINDPKSSTALKVDSQRLLALASSFKPAAPFGPYAKRELALADRLDDFEDSLALFDLRSDADTLIRSGSPDAAALAAEMAVECPKHPLVKSYLENIRTAPGPKKPSRK